MDGMAWLHAVGKKLKIEVSGAEKELKHLVASSIEDDLHHFTLDLKEASTQLMEEFSHPCLGINS